MGWIVNNHQSSVSKWGGARCTITGEPLVVEVPKR
jgi:hypothetical protein